jgi:hypothetical protein
LFQKRGYTLEDSSAHLDRAGTKVKGRSDGGGVGGCKEDWIRDGVREGTGPQMQEAVNLHNLEKYGKHRESLTAAQRVCGTSEWPTSAS